MVESIEGGVIVEMPISSNHEIELPNGRVEVVYHCHALAVLFDEGRNKVGPAAVGYGFSREEAWGNAVGIIKKELL